MTKDRGNEFGDPRTNWDNTDQAESVQRRTPKNRNDQPFHQVPGGTILEQAGGGIGNRPLPGFYPIFLGNGYIRLVPGWVLFHEPFKGDNHEVGGITRQVMPTLDDDPLDKKPYNDRPKRLLEEGIYVAYVKIFKNKAIVDFAKEEDYKDLEGDGHTIQAVCSFELTEDLKSIKNIKHYRSFIAYFPSGRAAHEVTAWAEYPEPEEGEEEPDPVYYALMRGGIYANIAGGSWGETLINGNNSFTEEALTVEAGDWLIAKWDTDEEGFLEGDVEIYLEDEEPGEMTPYEPECNGVSQTGHFEIPICKFLVDEDNGTIRTEQYLTGALWIFPDRTCKSETSGSGSSGSSSGSSKDTAIVPTKYHKSGYGAFYVEEAPDVRFNMVESRVLDGFETKMPLNPIFIEACVTGSIKVVGHSCDEICLLAFKIYEDMIVIRADRNAEGYEVNMRLSGIRHGYKDTFFEAKDFEEFQANEKFLALSEPGGLK